MYVALQLQNSEDFVRVLSRQFQGFGQVVRGPGQGSTSVFEKTEYGCARNGRQRIELRHCIRSCWSGWFLLAHWFRLTGADRSQRLAYKGSATILVRRHPARAERKLRLCLACAVEFTAEGEQTDTDKHQAARFRSRGRPLNVAVLGKHNESARGPIDECDFVARE